MDMNRYLDTEVGKQIAYDLEKWNADKCMTNADIARLSGKSSATISRAFNDYDITPKTASALCALMGKTLNDYMTEEKVETYDFDFLRQCLNDYLKAKGIKSTTFAIINGIDKDTVSRFANGDIAYLDKVDVQRICNGMHKSDKCFLLKKEEHNVSAVKPEKSMVPHSAKPENLIDSEEFRNQILTILSDTLSDTFYDFLEAHADEYIQRKKGWFRK